MILETGSYHCSVAQVFGYRHVKLTYSYIVVLQHSEIYRLLYVPTGLTLTISTFCPHSLFMCFLRISEQTAIISLHSIKCLVFIM